MNHQIAAPFQSPVYVPYEAEIEAEIEKLSLAIEQTPALSDLYPARWLAIQLLEGEESLLSEARAAPGGENILYLLESSLFRLRELYGEDIDVVVAGQRYNFVNSLVHSVVTRPAASSITFSDRVDRIVTHRLWGIPIFLVIMWIVFKITTDIADPYLNWVDQVINGPFTGWVVALLKLVGLGGSWLESLLVDGIIAGVGGILVFVPVLTLLYIALAVLEDSGYMARAAFVMDDLMAKIGLHGKSFLPMIVGFGCTVPALYATRTLENEKDRILTGLLVPFMSCGARLPVYILFAAIFFPNYTGLVVFSLYLIGIGAAIGLGFLLKRTIFKGKESTPLLMELPAYRLPTLRAIWLCVWQRLSSFLHTATTTILVASIVIWFLMAIPMRGEGRFAEVEIHHSAFASVAAALAPVFAPLGFGSWEPVGSLVSGLVAKEVVVSTLAQTHNVSTGSETAPTPNLGRDLLDIGTGFVRATVDTLKSVPLIVGVDLFGDAEIEDQTRLMRAVQTKFELISGGHSALAGLAFMVFVLLYTPCITTIAVERRELGTRWMWLSIIGQLTIAWLAAFLVFQGGVLLGFG